MPKGRPKKPDVERDAAGRIRRVPEAMRVALETRARHAGITLGERMTAEQAATLREPWRGCFAGRAIAAATDRTEAPTAATDRTELWQTVATIRQRRAAWLRSIDAPAEAPRGMSLPDVPPDEHAFGEAIPHDPLDPEERARVSERQWREIEALMFAANPLMLRAVCLDEPVRGDVAAWVRSVMEGLR